MKRFVWVAALGLLIGACGDSNPDATTTSDQATTTVNLEGLEEAVDALENLPECPNEAGDQLTDEMVDAGCLDDDGTIIFLGVWDCDDGRRLWGEGALWGWVGEAVVESPAGDSSSDPDYAAAFEEC